MLMARRTEILVDCNQIEYVKGASCVDQLCSVQPVQMSTLLLKNDTQANL